MVGNLFNNFKGKALFKMIIVILGPDGSGKSTMAEMLTLSLKRQGFSSRHYAHRFGILPELSSFKRKHDSKVIKQNNVALPGQPNYDLKEKRILFEDKFFHIKENSNENIIYFNCINKNVKIDEIRNLRSCLLYTSPSPRDYAASRMPSSA